MISWERAARAMLGKEREPGDDGDERRERRRTVSAAAQDNATTAV
jgi:hypothetical protein